MKEYIHPIIKHKQWDLAKSNIEKNGIALDLILFPLVTKKFCDDLIEDAEKNGIWTNAQPNVLPTQDMDIATLGNWDSIYNKLLRQYLYPMVRYAWDMDNTNFQAQNVLTKYEAGKVEYLKSHNDSSVFTSLVALNDEFEGGGTIYPKHNLTVNPKTGYAVVHPEINYRHGGTPLISGVRYIIVSFVQKKEKQKTSWVKF